MLRNPELRKLLLIAAPVCAVFTAVCLVLDTTAGILTGVLSVLLLSLYLLDVRRRYRTMARLAEDIDAVLHGRRDVSFAQYTEGEVSLLRSELRKMTVRLSEQADQLLKEKVQLAESMADVSHQIRTPLTAMGLTLAVAQETADERARARALRELEGMIERVGWLVSALLKLAKADAGAITVRATCVEARQVVARAMGPLAASLDLRGVTCEVHCEGDPHFTGDMAWSAEALENVLKNCMEHTPAGGAIRVSVRQDALACRIRVTDTGPGIAPEDLPHVFERFYRGKGSAMATEGERADGPRAQGFGIGLALAQSLMAAQGGTLRASNAPEGGARFDFTFPSVVV